MGNAAINRAHMCTSAPNRVCVKSMILTVLQVKYFCVKWQISQRGETILEGKYPWSRSLIITAWCVPASYAAWRNKQAIIIQNKMLSAFYIHMWKMWAATILARMNVMVCLILNSLISKTRFLRLGEFGISVCGLDTDVLKCSAKTEPHSSKTHRFWDPIAQQRWVSRQS